MDNMIEFSSDEKRIIKDQFFPEGTSDAEMQYCMGVAKNMGLNPILKEIYFVERTAQSDGKWIKKIEPTVGKNAYLKLAHQSGEFEGIESSVEIKRVPKLVDGVWKEMEELTATAIVYKKGAVRPTIKAVHYSEYVQRKKDGEPTKFWKEKPITMLKKVAESQALREAFSLYGAYDESETESNETESYRSETLAQIGQKKAIRARQPKKREVAAIIEAEKLKSEDIDSFDEVTGEISSE